MRAGVSEVRTKGRENARAQRVRGPEAGAAAAAARGLPKPPRRAAGLFRFRGGSAMRGVSHAPLTSGEAMG